MPAPIATLWAGSSWLTSGTIFMLIRLPLSTVGVKARLTPYCLYSIRTCPELLPGTGIGYSPPARKFAVSPDSATRLGWARRRARPRSYSAFSITSTCGLLVSRVAPLVQDGGEQGSTRPMVAFLARG